MFSQPQDEHRWLDSFVGEWTVESECSMGPDQPPTKTTGRVTARSLGGLWLLMETEGASPDGGLWKSLLTLGYDPQAQRYVGSFVGSMMTHFWTYAGTLDVARRKLVLDTTGPKFDGSGGMTQYQDIVETVDRDHWILSSQILGDDGNWLPFMTAHHRRVG